MSSRLAGAILALTAAVFLALSLVATSWWNGHPSFDGREIDAKTIYVGPLGAQGCNTGGDGTCTTLELASASSIPGYAALGLSGVLAIAALLLALTTFLGAEVRTTIAKAVLGLAGGAAVVLVLQIAIGPRLAGGHQVTMHIGAGVILVFVALVVAVGGAVLAKRPLPKPELRPSRAAIAPALAAPPVASGGSQPVDVLALIQDDVLRPSRPAIAQPAGTQPEPLFTGAPQLRALYEADPAQGGTAGYVPGTRPPLPTRAPTPLSHSAVAAVVGLPTPPPFTAPVPSSAMIEGRTKPASVPPPPVPSRTQPPPFAAQPPAFTPAATPPPPGPSLPPPRTRAGTQPPPPGAIAARLKASSIPPPVRAKPPSLAPSGSGAMSASLGPSSASMVPPPVIPAPTGPRTLAAAVVPPPVAATAPKLPVRAVTDPADHFETMERRREDVGDTTDASVVPPPPEDDALERPSTETDDIETSSVEKLERASSQAETEAVDKFDAAALATGDTTDASAPPVPSNTPAPVVVPAPAAAPKIPISTAPDSLPPPTEKQAATSGPSPACPQCEAPMAWVEEHLRFYCKSCRMYF